MLIEVSPGTAAAAVSMLGAPPSGPEGTAAVATRLPVAAPAAALVGVGTAGVGTADGGMAGPAGCTGETAGGTGCGLAV